MVATLRDADESATTAVSEVSLSRDVARLSEVAELSEGPEDDDNGKQSYDNFTSHRKHIRMKVIKYRYLAVTKLTSPLFSFL